DADKLWLGGGFVLYARSRLSSCFALYLVLRHDRYPVGMHHAKNGAHEKIRTSDLQLRRLYAKPLRLYVKALGASKFAICTDLTARTLCARHAARVNSLFCSRPKYLPNGSNLGVSLLPLRRKPYTWVDSGYSCA